MYFNHFILMYDVSINCEKKNMIRVLYHSQTLRIFIIFHRIYGRCMDQTDGQITELILQFHDQIKYICCTYSNFNYGRNQCEQIFRNRDT